MDINKIAKDNQLFYDTVVGFEMLDLSFIQAVTESFDEPSLYSTINKPGYINIDCTDVKKRCSHGSFTNAVNNGILGKIGMSISNSITGDLNESICINNIS